jgi:hypothetical protein
VRLTNVAIDAVDLAVDWPNDHLMPPVNP